MAVTAATGMLVGLALMLAPPAITVLAVVLGEAARERAGVGNGR